MKTITRGRINVTENGISLEPVETYHVELNGWYYLGASSSPKLVKVVKAEADRFWYQTYHELANNEGQPVQIERWIGEDLIASGNATQRTNFTQWFADEPEILAERLYTLDKHDLSEESKQALELLQAECEVCNTREAQDRRRTFGYEIEDAIREYCRLHREDTDYWPVEDHNVYPGDTVNYADHPSAVPYTCAGCGNEIYVNINHSNGKQWCDTCFAVVIQEGEPGRIPMGTRVCVRDNEYGVIDGQWAHNRYGVRLDNNMLLLVNENEITVTPSARKFATPDIHTVKPGDQVAFVDGPGYTPALPAEQGIAYGVKRSIWGDQLKVKITDDSGNVRFEYVLHFVSVGIGAYYIGQNRYK